MLLEVYDSFRSQAAGRNQTVPGETASADEQEHRSVPELDQHRVA